MKRVHRVCYLITQLENTARDGEPQRTVCEECPAWERSEHYGRVKRGCRALAEEMVNVAQTGDPWRRKRSTWPLKPCNPKVRE